MNLLLERWGSQRGHEPPSSGAAAKGGHLPQDAGADGNSQRRSGQHHSSAASRSLPAKWFLAPGSGQAGKSPVELGKGQTGSPLQKEPFLKQEGRSGKDSGGGAPTGRQGWLPSSPTWGDLQPSLKKSIAGTGRIPKCLGRAGCGLVRIHPAFWLSLPDGSLRGWGPRLLRPLSAVSSDTCRQLLFPSLLRHAIVLILSIRFCFISAHPPVCSWPYLSTPGKPRPCISTSQTHPGPRKRHHQPLGAVLHTSLVP